MYGVALVALLIGMAGCSAQPPTVSADSPARDAAEAEEEARQARILTESIDIVYAGDPQPEWFDSFVKLDVVDGWAEVQTSLTEADAALADSMCRDIAAVTFDDNAEPIGVTDVLIFGSGGVDLADCDVIE